MPFTASYDSFTKILSALVSLGFLAIIIATHNPIISILAIVVILISFAYSPRGYIVSDRSILVRRLAGPPVSHWRTFAKCGVPLRTTRGAACGSGVAVGFLDITACSVPRSSANSPSTSRIEITS